MKLIDFIYNICFEPGRKLGFPKILASLWTSYILTQLAFSIVYGIVYYAYPFTGFKMSSIGASIMAMVLFVLTYRKIDSHYVKGNKEIKETRFRVLFIIAYPILMLGSLMILILALLAFHIKS
jgi:hypothetical protein